MKNLFLGLLLGLSLSCATAKFKLGVVEQLTLLVDVENGGLMYPHCTDRTFFRKKCKNMEIKRWDLKNIEHAKELKNFVCKDINRKW